MAKIQSTVPCKLYAQWSSWKLKDPINVGNMVRVDKTAQGYPTAIMYLGEVYIFKAANADGVHYMKEPLGYFVPEMLENL